MRFRQKINIGLTCGLWLLSHFCDPGVAQTNNYDTTLFPTPAILEPNVQFWEDVYSRYSEREVILHDAETLNIIYDVVNLDSLFHGVQVSDRLLWKKVELIKKGYKSTLLRLARKRHLDLSALRGKERRVASLFGAELNAKRLRRAAKNIRAQSGLRERFLLGLKRSGLYLSKMREIFQDAGLPLELLVLPHVESSFNYAAYSKFGAAGVWQFTRSTGRHFLRINYEVDERLDPIRATEAAAKLLQHNYEELGSWPLAITAYNHGLYGMKRARRKYGDDLGRIIQHYRSRSFGFASRNFYAEFLAALHIATNYKAYFGEIEFQRPRRYISFTPPDYVSVRGLLKELHISLEEFAQFNPALRKPVLHSRRRIPKNFELRIPYQEGLDVQALYARISPELKFDRQVRPKWHKVRRGENLSSIARRYRVAVGDLMAANDIRNPHRIYVGQNLQIPGPNRGRRRSALVEASLVTEGARRGILDVAPAEASPAADVAVTPKTHAAPRTNALPEVDYVSARTGSVGDVIVPHSEALRRVDEQRFKREAASVEEVMAMALPGHHVVMTRDMVVRVVKPQHPLPTERGEWEVAFPENGQVRVEADETLGHFADWLDVPTWKLRRINGLSYAQPLQLGQRLWLTFENVTPEEFHQRRVEYHQGIEEDFFRNFTVDGEQTYVVQPGDNIWLICNHRFGLPFWLIQKYNPQADLANLVAGQELVIPTVSSHFPTEILEE